MVHNHEERSENDDDTTVTNDTAEKNKNDNIDNVGVVYESLPEK